MDDLTTAEDNSLAGTAALSEASQNLRISLGDFGDGELSEITLDTVRELANNLTALKQAVIAREAENRVFQRCVEEIQAAAEYLSLFQDGGADLLELL